MHHPTDRIEHITAFVTPVVEHWLEREIAQWVHHEGTLLPRNYISPPRGTNHRWLNHRGRSRLANGTQLHQSGRPERGLGLSLLLLRPHLVRHQLDDQLFILQLRLSRGYSGGSRRATSPLPPRISMCPTSLSSPTRWGEGEV